MILNQLIDELPIAVIDFETTGLYAGPDRVVEAAVVRIEPGSLPASGSESAKAARASPEASRRSHSSFCRARPAYARMSATSE